MRKTRFVFGFLVLCTLIGLAPSGLSLPGEASAAEKIVFGLDWVPYGKYVGYYVARDKGFYKEAGFDEVVFERGFGGASVMVGNEKQQIGIESVGGVVLARDKKVPIKLVSMWHERLMMNVLVLKSSGIKTSKDLEGKRLGVTIGDAIHRNWPIFAESVGLKSWQFAPMDPAAKNPSLLAKTVDGILTYATVTVGLKFQAKARGEDLVEFLFSDHGVRLAQDGLIASEKAIANSPEKIRRMIAASLKGNAWAIENPEEGVNIFLRSIPDASREVTRASWDLSSRFQVWGNLKEKGLGYIDRDLMEATRKTMARAYGIASPPALDDLYTDKVLPRDLPKPKLPAM